MQESYVLYRDNNKEYVDELIEYLVLIGYLN